MYLDEAFDRSHLAHEERIEEIRHGFIFAHDLKAHDKWWNARRATRPSRGLVGDALETAVAGIARMFPGNVMRETVGG